MQQITLTISRITSTTNLKRASSIEHQVRLDNLGLKKMNKLFASFILKKLLDKIHTFCDFVMFAKSSCTCGYHIKFQACKRKQFL